MSKKKKRRVLNSWHFPEGYLMKTVAARLHDLGLRGRALQEKFEGIFPNWQRYFPKPISESAIVHRADKARRYPSEDPETHPVMRRYWRTAGAVVRRGKRLGKREIAKITKRSRQTEAA